MGRGAGTRPTCQPGLLHPRVPVPAAPDRIDQALQLFFGDQLGRGELGDLPVQLLPPLRSLRASRTPMEKARRRSARIVAASRQISAMSRSCCPAASACRCTNSSRLCVRASWRSVNFSRRSSIVTFYFDLATLFNRRLFRGDVSSEPGGTGAWTRADGRGW